MELYTDEYQATRLHIQAQILAGLVANPQLLGLMDNAQLVKRAGTLTDLLMQDNNMRQTKRVDTGPK